MQPTIAVIGSIVIDFPLILPRPAISGETLKVETPGMNLGGKAVNQGLQALLCGVSPLLVGKVGHDVFGEWARSELAHYHLRTDAVRTAASSTSWAVPIIESSTQYILHVAGANAAMTPEDITDSHPLWEEARWLLVQGEIPSEASLRAAQLMHRQHGQVICDPAPADSMTPELLRAADILTPNTQELRVLTHRQSNDLEEQVHILWAEYPGLSTLAVTMGAEGVWFQERGNHGQHITPPRVQAADPTAAGDAFNGAFVAALSTGFSPRKACEIGCCAGALAATTVGSAKSLASQEDIMALWEKTYHTPAMRDEKRVF
ncbi:MAG: ribokinase [Firmicutes bacterium]|nr:ribokinase [Bacillota bacterium]